MQPQAPQGSGPAVGGQVAGYQLEARLGQGGMATVFLGRSLLDSESVRAIKIVRGDLASRPEFVERFVREARTLERLTHPNVVRAYKAGIEGGVLYLEMELLDGRSLSEVVPTGQRVPPLDALRYVMLASEGVASAHGLGVVHRDLKPDNIFLTHNGLVKVLDFGLAKARDDADRASGATVAGTMPGTPAYMPPEVCMGEVPGPAADVYALGMTLYELLLGWHPYRPPGQPAPTALVMMNLQVTRPLPDPAPLLLDAPPGTAAVVARATAKDPTQRFATARELADALRGVLSAAEGPRSAAGATQVALPTFRAGTPTPASWGTMSQPGMATVPPPAPHSRMPLVLGATGLLVVLGGGGAAAWFATRRAEVAEAEAAAAEVSVDPIAAAALGNGWVRVDPPPAARYNEDPVVLGVPAGTGDAIKGFRPSRDVRPPAVPYLMHAHEVTWGEIGPWLDAHPDLRFDVPAWAQAVSALDGYPVGGIPWDTARQYCLAIGGTLPTEEQWEYAARGASLRPYSWGAQPLDPIRTRAWGGDDLTPMPAGASDQDRTPGAEGQVIHDLVGNVQEWTADLYRADEPGTDERWVTADGHTWRAIRGLPLRGVDKQAVPTLGAAWRDRQCGTGSSCASIWSKGTRFAMTGFRCVKPAPVEEKAR